MPHSVFADAALQTEFERRGYIVIEDLDSAFLGLIEELYESKKAHQSSAALPISYNAGLVELRRPTLATAQRLVEILRPRLTATYRPLLADLMVKSVGARSMEPHRHWSLTDESRYMALTCWTPLETASEKNGCMQLLPGSHRDRAFTGLRVYPDFVERLENVPVSRGQVLVMDNRMIHGSAGNTTDQPRRALATQCVPVGAPVYCCYDNGPMVDVYEVTDAGCLEYIPSAPPKEGRLLVRLPGPRSGKPYYDRARELGAHP